MNLHFAFASLLALSEVALAHYRFTHIETPSGTSYNAIRYPLTYDPIMDATSTDMRCNIVDPAVPATEVVTIEAGSTIAFGLSNVIFHPGPAALYLGRVPDGDSVTEWDGSGKSWFKFKDFGGVYDPEMWDFEVLNERYINATIPATTPPGDYLLRAEQIGLLIPFEPQYYVSCAQVRIVSPATGVPAGTPGPLVEIPGHFTPDDEGLQLDIYNPVEGYTYRVPGPDPWVG